MPVVAATVEPRRADELAPGGRAGSASTSRPGPRSDLRPPHPRPVSTSPPPGVIALAVDATGNQLVIGYEDGRPATIDLTLLGEGGVDLGLEPTTS